MNYIIGDLHANIAELKRLVGILDLTPKDQLIFLGDYIDKNIFTTEIIEFLNRLKQNYHCVFLKGDHEFVWERYLNHNELFRQEFLLKYGSVEALRLYANEGDKELILNNKIPQIKNFLRPYLDFCEETRDYYFADGYLAMHAGLAAEQLPESPIVFKEENYFLRENKMNLGKKYLNKYIIVAGHTYYGQEPVVKGGYIGIDLGAGYGGFIGAFNIKKNEVIRSDGKIFKL